MTSQGWKTGENAEKSPSVHYANWKETILLKKQMHVLERSEKNVIHRIKIDQKVLFKRFQDKLYRSKLCEARMHGNKEIERELRAKNLHGLNTDFGSVEKDYEFLTKLQNNRKKSQQYKQKKHPKITVTIPKDTQKELVDDVFMDGNGTRRRSNSVSECMTSRSTGTLAGLPLPTVDRPSTTGSRPQQREVEVSVQSLPLKKDIQLSIATKGKKQNNKLTLDLPVKQKARPHTCGPSLLQQVTNEATSGSRRPSEQENHRKKSSSFFEDERKIDVVELQLKAIKSLNYDQKIQEFVDTLNDLVVDDIEDRDYYTLRLRAAMKEISGIKYEQVPGTPEDEYNRHVGNLDLKSLTFKNLKFDFSSRDTVTTADNFRPDYQPVILSSDESSDDDDDI